MKARLKTVPSTGQPVAGPVLRSILVVDAEGSTRRTNPMRGELRRIMYALLDRALRATGIDHEHLEKPTDRGDGVMLLFRPDDDVPKTLLLGELIPKLAALLVEHNAAVTRPGLELRLRVAFHAGEVHGDGWGFYGEDIDVACRLLDSPSVKKSLQEAATAPLVLVISEEIHSAIVRHEYVDIGPQVSSVRVRVGRLRRGLVHVPVPASAEGTLPVTRAKTALRAVGQPSGRPAGATAGKLPLVSARVLVPPGGRPPA